MVKAQRRGFQVPIFKQLRSYKRSWLRCDLVAGVTVAALIVPKNLGYAGIAGVPLQNGVTLRLTQLKPVPRAILERDGVIGLIGSDHIHGNIQRAVEAEQADAERGHKDLN